MQKAPTKVYCILNLQFYGTVLLVVHRVKVRVKCLVATLYLKYNCVDSTFLTCTKSLREYCLQLQSWITAVHVLDFDAENRFCDICMFDFSFCCFNALFALCLDEMVFFELQLWAFVKGFLQSPSQMCELTCYSLTEQPPKTLYTP